MTWTRWRRVLCVQLLVGCVSAVVWAAPPAREPQVLLKQAIDLYVVGRYAEASDILRPLVESQVLRDRADQLEALRTYGISLYLSGAKPGAERAFRSLLRLEPEARLDPAFVRPEVVAFFDSVRRRHQLEIHKIERGAAKPFVANFLPPWGQFQNRQRTKAFVLLGSESALLAGSVTTFGLLWAWRGDDRQFDGHEDAYRPLFIVNIVTSALLVATVLYGMADGLYYYYRVPQPLKEDKGDVALNRQPSGAPVGIAF